MNTNKKDKKSNKVFRDSSNENQHKEVVKLKKTILLQNKNNLGTKIKFNICAERAVLSLKSNILLSVLEYF